MFCGCANFVCKYFVFLTWCLTLGWNMFRNQFIECNLVISLKGVARLHSLLDKEVLQKGEGFVTTASVPRP